MQGVVLEFNERVDEIEAYLDFIRRVDAGEVLLAKAETRDPAYSSIAQQDLLRTFKASALLMLYNLMESSVTNAVEAIFDELEQQAIPFDQCREEIRIVVLGNIRRHEPQRLLSEIAILATDIITKTFRRETIVSGNVDAREIREVAKRYGFPEPQSRGDRLLTVKTNRNDLAHGGKSFAEVGRSFTVQDILDIKHDVVAYLTETLNHVADYLRARNYATSMASPA